MWKKVLVPGVPEHLHPILYSIYLYQGITSVSHSTLPHSTLHNSTQLQKDTSSFRHYIIKGKLKIELPKTFKVEKLTLEDVQKMIEDKKPKTKKKATKKKTVKKKATKK